MTDNSSSSFDAFLRQQRPLVAQAFVNGDPEPLRAISTTRDPATFFGPGGGIEQGAHKVLAVNEAGARRFEPGGTTEMEVLHQGSGSDLGYWTGLQRATVVAGPNREPTQMTLRVTEAFRREDGAWKLIHRHADTLASAAR